MTTLEKAGLYLSIFIIINLFTFIGFSKNGVLDYMELKKSHTDILEQINEVGLKNQKLENEIISLKTDMNYIKHVAKHEHDMAEKDDLIFKDKPANRGNIK